MAEVIIYSTEYCPYCTRAKLLLSKKNQNFVDIRVDLEPQLRDEMKHKSGRSTVPQVFINGQHVGGCDDLYALESQGTLDELLKG